MNYHDVALDQVYTSLQSSEKGLTSVDATHRLEMYGPNELKKIKRRSTLLLFLSQFNDFLIWILIGAALVSSLVGDFVDTAVIVVILILNALLGFFQEFKAEKAIEKLMQLTSPKATILRDGQKKEAVAREIVPGDIMMFSVGTKLVADCRLIEAVNLECEEAPLTGESVPAIKTTGIVESSASIGDRHNMVYTGTIVAKGRGMGIVTSTGMQSELGKIAGLISDTTRVDTPLKKNLETFGRKVGIGVLIICVFIFALGISQGKDSVVMLLAAISLAVAAVPEGLPAVVTITLSLGVQRMAKHKALIRHLPAVETLGSTTIICSDKTGTLTHDQMTVTSLYVDGKVTQIHGEGYDPSEKFSTSKSIELLLLAGALCNDSDIVKKEGVYDNIGDPTEAALVTSAMKGGLSVHDLRARHKRIAEIPFTSERKMMSTLHLYKGKKTLYTKGSVDAILARCKKILVDGKVVDLKQKHIKEILSQNVTFSSEALRVLAFAYREAQVQTTSENHLIFIGLQAMLDPPRDEAIEAIAKCKDAGIRVVMITGDHKITAQAIAKKMGLGTRAMTGAELDNASIDSVVENIDVFARVNPEHKIKLVEAFQKQGHVVAMTGDGVNDAPALKKADIGVAMGITGTDVAKEAAEMILADDNFATLVSAVEQGRGIYGNIRKFLAFLISGNIGEILVILLAVLFGLSLPLTAILILVINLVTDGLPATALSVDPFEPNVMKKPPRDLKEPIYSNMNSFILYYPIILTIVTLGLFWTTHTYTNDLIKAQTVAFLSIAFFELFQAFSARSLEQSSFQVGIFKNKYLVGTVLVSLVTCLALIYIPALQVLFGTTTLNFFEVITILLLSSIGFIFLETSKFFKHRKATLAATD